MFNTYTKKWLTEDLFKPGFAFNSSSAGVHDFLYKVPQGADISVFRDYINSLPYVDQPGVFGLHVNADLTFRLQESAYMLKTIQVGLYPWGCKVPKFTRSGATLLSRLLFAVSFFLPQKNHLHLWLQETLPKASSGGKGKSREDTVREKCVEMLSKMPEDFQERVYKEQVSKLSGPPALNVKGLAVPLNIFLFQVKRSCLPPVASHGCKPARSKGPFLQRTSAKFVIFEKAVRNAMWQTLAPLIKRLTPSTDSTLLFSYCLRKCNACSEFCALYVQTCLLSLAQSTAPSS